jgi:GH18 family chitinase
MGQNSQAKAGDLVRYAKKPKYAIPTNEKPVGIILGHHSLLIGKDPKQQAIMEMVKVRWSIGKWNSSGGFSIEHPDDLVIVQRS